MMGCDDRPQGEACNCCGDAELRNLIKELSERIRQNETTIEELRNRTVTLPSYIDCSGLRIPDNAALATCSDLQVAISGIKIPNIPNIPDISGLRGRVQQLESEISRLNTLISNLNTIISNPGRDNNFGGRVDQATIDGLVQQIQNINNMFTAINRRLNEFQICCDEVKAEIDKLKQGAGGGDCDYNGWSVEVGSRLVQHNEPDYGRRFQAVVSGPALKNFTILTDKGTQHQGTTNDSGTADIRWQEGTGTGYAYSYSTVLRIVHCGREVARGNVFHV